MESKESYMKRVIRDVLPTDCSPRKTSLNFFKGLVYEPTLCAMVATWAGGVVRSACVCVLLLLDVLIVSPFEH